MLQLINQILAFVFDKLKAKSPIAATVILSVLAGLYAVANSLPADILPEWGETIIEWVIIIYGALSGSRTTKFIKKDLKK
tara:strand:- start:2503 stop:2742 length:240 start_codon:yes stop_codon:yes gene_type:complete